MSLGAALNWRSLAEAIGRLDPRRRDELLEQAEKRRDALADEANAYRELIKSRGWKLLVARVDAQVVRTTRDVMLQPPAPSRRDPAGTLWRRQREWWCAEAAGQRYVLGVPEQIIAQADGLTETLREEDA
jgi:hypothetical protein